MDEDRDSSSPSSGAFNIDQGCNGANKMDRLLIAELKDSDRNWSHVGDVEIDSELFGYTDNENPTPNHCHPHFGNTARAFIRAWKKGTCRIFCSDVLCKF